MRTWRSGHHMATMPSLSTALEHGVAYGIPWAVTIEHS
jgi:hypothetical protein